MLRGYPYPTMTQLIPNAIQRPDSEKRSNMAAIDNEIKSLAHANRWQLNRLLGSIIWGTVFHGVVANLKFAVT